MTYLAIKNLHVTSVILSYALFFARGVWMMRDSVLLDRRWVKIVPHLIDTVLLASAIALALMLQQYPLGAAWLTAKVIGLAAYIALGMVALRRGRTKRGRITAWIAAQLVFFYIITVAMTKQPLPFAG